jgi:ACS family hexuronate transporter-like MFS transporter
MNTRWRVAILVSAAIAISYLDRQTLPVAIGEIRKEIPISNQVKAFLDSAFLVTYGLMYLGGGKLADVLGTRRGFLVIMIFWSLACASHAFAANYGMAPILGLPFAVVMLATSRLLLGIGEGGGFPAATRAVAEWFPVKERSTAMGIINAGTGVGGIAAPPLIAWVLTSFHWLGISPWRWVFLLTGAFGLCWILWWFKFYFPPENHPKLQAAERALIEAGTEAQSSIKASAIPLSTLLRFRETWGIVFAKFLTDAAWYFYMFWLPKYLLDARGFDIKKVGSVAWIPFAAAGVGCLCGGGLSSWLLHRGHSVNAARKIALGLSAAMMPCVMLVPQVSVPWVIVLFSIAFFGQQSWSTLVMILPTDLFPKRALGTVAGLVGLGGAMGGVVLGQLAGYLLDHGFSYTPVLIIAGSLHVIAFLIICLAIPSLRPCPLPDPI